MISHSIVVCSIIKTVIPTPAPLNPHTVPPITGVATSVTAFIGFAQSGPIETPTEISSFAQYEAQFGPLVATSPMGFAVNLFFVNGGTSLYIVRVASQPVLTTVETALQALNSVSILNLLCIPGVTDPAILAQARSYCERRRSFLILDADPSATTSQQLLDLVNGIALPRSVSAAVYGPWINIPDPLNPPALRMVPPSGAVAGIYARTDQNFGVWKAPAGTDAALLGVTSLAGAIDENGARILQERGLNPLRTLPASGNVVWGARTLVPASGDSNGWEYIPVRRLGLYIEQSVDTGLSWVVFEPNGPALWAQVQSVVSDFLQQLFLQGAFQGSTPAQAYFVKCDTTTMTQSDIDQGILNVVIGFAPLRPAEFVVFRIQAL